MSRKERERLTIMTGVTEQELTLGQASELMGVCYRQSKRIWRRYREDGDAGLVPRLRGQPSARRKPPKLRGSNNWWKRSNDRADGQPHTPKVC